MTDETDGDVNIVSYLNGFELVGVTSSSFENDFVFDASSSRTSFTSFAEATVLMLSDAGAVLADVTVAFPSTLGFVVSGVVGFVGFGRKQVQGECVNARCWV